ncbi:MAG: tRNA (guanosine(37)-N1)-methyltransferase TrmD [Candidatus Doudnabacteria bacterium]|nr:tRNA (guanosine(37)-N1)-methyltransferase TrmD [Candidatus Doudnabacteria bacterium]
MRFDVITIFPEIFQGFTQAALIARAVKKKIISVRLHNLRRWTKDAHRTVDDRPYGGGPGMVLLVKPISAAVRSLARSKKSRVILFSAKGRKFNQQSAKRLAKFDQLIMICGRYEGVDERVARYIAQEELSIGDYVLFGGEVPAMVVIEAVTRLLPGAIGKQSSLAEESFDFSSKVEQKELAGLVEYPHYTRPESFLIGGKPRRVPKVLLSGNHTEIAKWRAQQARLATKKRG